MKFNNQLENDEPPVIYYGFRDDSFKQLIKNLLSVGHLKSHYIDALTDDSAMAVYSNVFTSTTADPENNYEVYEQKGDVTANKFLVWYMYRRFPQLKCTKGVKVVARLRINYGSKQSFAPIAESLGFWSFITASEDERSHNKRPLLEDTLEAFVGATEDLIDTRIKTCAGYAIVYDILKAIFDAKNISLNYEDLYDAKTRLKELFDVNKTNLGTLEYKEDPKNEDDKLTTSKLYQKINEKEGKSYHGFSPTKRADGSVDWLKLIGQGTAALKADAQQRAAQQGIETMKLRGYSKPIPEIYAFFNNIKK